MKLKNRIALITGAGGGFGRCIALGMAAEGARIGVNDIDPDFRYVNTRIAVNPRRTRVYATERNSACYYKKGGNLGAFVYAEDLFWDINL